MQGGILEGCNEIVDEFYECNFGTRTPRYNNKSNVSNICEKYKDLFKKPHYEEVTVKIYNTICNNFNNSEYSDKGRSDKNWRWEKQKLISIMNESTEKKLEKAIVALDENDKWINQVPTASGLCNHMSDKLRNIDIIHKVTSKVYEFIELKAKRGTNNPFYASIEILQYALLYIFFRKELYGNIIKKNNNVLLEANKINLVVLAPSDYYHNFKKECAEKLQRQFTSDLNKLVNRLNLSNLKFVFSYQMFDKTLSNIENEIKNQIFIKINKSEFDIKSDEIRMYINDLYNNKKNILDSI